jgi:hypothetical protein
VVSRVPVSAARRLSLPGEKLPNWWSTTFGPSFAVLEVDLMFLGRPLALFVTQLTAGDRLTREKQAQAVAGHIDQPREGKAVLAAALFSTPARKGNDADGRGDYALDLVRHRRNLVTLLGDYEVRADPARYVSFDDGSGEPWLADWILPERGLEVLRFEILDPSPALSSHRPLLLELKP